jgi:hypothetical protein
MKNVTPRHGKNVPAMTTEKTRASPKKDGAKWTMQGMIASKGIFLLTSVSWNALNVGRSTKLIDLFQLYPFR